MAEPTCSPAAGPQSIVVGGYYNFACGYYSVAVGGDYNGSDYLSDNVNILGGQDSEITSGLFGTIVGGEYNALTGSYDFIGGGQSNGVSGQYPVIVGGNTNSATANYAFIGDGSNNTVSAIYGTLTGGQDNKVPGSWGTVGGGYGNQAGEIATVPGGKNNIANGEGSFAAGFGSTADYAGDFVWSDFASGATALKGTADDQFLARASGGVTFYSSPTLASGVKLAAGSGTWASLSDRNAKSAVVPVSDDDILARVAALPISEWSYTTERGVRHVGPMAQDFYAAFNVGEDDRHITSIDEDGVALAAIKALDARVAAKDAEIRSLRADMRRRDARLESSDASLRRQMAMLVNEVRELRDAGAATRVRR